MLVIVVLFVVTAALNETGVTGFGVVWEVVLIPAATIDAKGDWDKSGGIRESIKLLFDEWFVSFTLLLLIFIQLNKWNIFKLIIVLTKFNGGYITTS